MVQLAWEQTQDPEHLGFAPCRGSSRPLEQRLRPPCRQEAAGRFCSSKGLEDDYELTQEVLGSGFTGEVRVGVCRQTGRSVAVKGFVKKALTARMQAELQREVDVYMAVDHPNIARLERVYEGEDETHLVMEHLKGGEVFQRLTERGTFTEKDAAGVVRQLLQAVAYLHSQHVVHRDLKLENLMYEGGEGDAVKLIDFGLATRWDGKAPLTQRCGTLHYAAPEVFACQYTEKADLWSVGAITYMLLTGKPLYTGEDSLVQQKAKAGRVDCSRSFMRLSLEAMCFVRALLLVDPALRPSASAALHHPWLKRLAPPSTVPIDAGVLRGLQAFPRASHLRRACMLVVAWTAPAEEEARLRQQFRALDADGNGVISKEELLRALETCEGVSEASLEDVLTSLDTNSDGSITFREFLAATLPQPAQLQEDAIRVTFARFDLDGRGRLTAAGLQEVLGGARGDSCAAEVQDEVDCADNSGVSFEEWRAHLQLSATSPTPPRSCRARRNQAPSVDCPRASYASAGLSTLGKLQVCGCQIQPAKQAASGLAALLEMLGAFSTFWAAAMKLARLATVVRGMRPASLKDPA